MVRRSGTITTLIAGILSLIVLFSSLPFPVSAATLEEKQAEAEKVRQQIEAMKIESQRLAQDYNKSLDEYETIRNLSEANRQRLEKAQNDYKRARAIMNDRLRSIYKSGDVNSLEVLLESNSLDDLLNRYDFFNYIGNRDAQIFNEVRRLREEISQRQRSLEEEEARKSQALASVNAKRMTMETSLQEQQKYLESVNAEVLKLLATSYGGGSGGTPVLTSIGNFVFPVNGPHSFSDDWHAPRTGHLHQGCDIFAAMGTPSVACVTGTVYQGEGGNAGKYVRLAGDDGNVFYYMHLQRYAATGHVTAGTVVGNALGGPPHLHFEVHPGGGAAVPPYPILLAADR